MGFAGRVVHSEVFGWDRYGFNKKCVGTRYAKLVFLYPVGSKDHVVHSRVSGHEMWTHYFLSSGGTGTDSIKNARDTLH
jgi:hypothetical protein